MWTGKAGDDGGASNGGRRGSGGGGSEHGGASDGGRPGTLEGNADLELDAVEFCRILSGRAAGHGLLAVKVPF